MSLVVKRLLGAAIAAMLGIGIAVIVAGPSLGAGSSQRTLRLAARAGVAGDATNADDVGGTTSTSPNGETTTTSGAETDTDTTSTDPGATSTTTSGDVSGQAPSDPGTGTGGCLPLVCVTVTNTTTLPGTTVTNTSTVTNTETNTQTRTVTQTQPGTVRTVTGPGGTTTVTGPGGTQTLTSPGGTTTVISPPTTQTVTSPAPVSKHGPRGYVSSLMSWTFAYTRNYTTVASLAVTGLSSGSYLTVSCSGGGCPFDRASASVVAKCVRAHNSRRRRCTHPTSMRLSPRFRGRHLSAGSHIVVTITHRRWVGKYYRFGMRAGRTPTVLVSCLAPGGTRPGKGCTAR